MTRPALLKKIIFTAVCSLFITTSCLAVPAQAVTGSGPARPARIVSLSPAITESLLLLGVGLAAAVGGSWLASRDTRKIR